MNTLFILKCVALSAASLTQEITFSESASSDKVTMAVRDVQDMVKTKDITRVEFDQGVIVVSKSGMPPVVTVYRLEINALRDGGKFRKYIDTGDGKLQLVKDDKYTCS